MCPVIERSLNKANHHVEQWQQLEREAISEILFADTDSESGAEGSDVEDEFEKEEEQQKQEQASA